MNTKALTLLLTGTDEDIDALEALINHSINNHFPRVMVLRKEINPLLKTVGYGGCPFFQALNVYLNRQLSEIEKLA